MEYRKSYSLYYFATRLCTKTCALTDAVLQHNLKKTRRFDTSRTSQRTNKSDDRNAEDQAGLSTTRNDRHGTEEFPKSAGLVSKSVCSNFKGEQSDDRARRDDAKTLTHIDSLSRSRFA